MLRIPYTIEMQKQDKLHGNAKEDRDLMRKLHNSIIEQAEKQGFQGITETDLFTLSGDYEVLTTVFRDKEHRERVSLGIEEPNTVGRCDCLIINLNKMEVL